MYEFNRQLNKGAEGERQLDEAFSLDYVIQKATAAEQRQGIDRIFVRRRDGLRLKVEYKTDFLAHRTGNAFIETISVDTAGKSGWAYSSDADYLIYFVFEDLLVYFVPMTIVRERLPLWLRRYPKKVAQNDGYQTHGIIVPLTEFERYSEQVISL